MKRFVILIVSVLIFYSTFLLSQELDCKVILNTESIQSAQRDYLRNFSSDIERYLNNTRFTSEDLDGEKIQCSFDIFFQNALSDNRYKVQVVIVSQRPIYIGNDKSERTTPVLRILDNNWEFTYTPNQPMRHDEMTFDQLTGFLDFYAYIIIGYDMETYVPMSGSSCFQKAFNIVQQASNSSVAADWQSSSASYSKYGLTDELSNVKYNSFRAAFNNYHFDGIDLIATQQQKALENILKSIESIDDVRRRQNITSIIIKQFFDAKYREIAEVFLTYPDRDVYEILSKYDQEHRSTYQEMKTRQ